MTYQRGQRVRIIVTGDVEDVCPDNGEQLLVITYDDGDGGRAAASAVLASPDVQVESVAPAYRSELLR